MANSDKKKYIAGRPTAWPEPTTDLSRRLHEILPDMGKQQLGLRFFKMSEKGVHSILSGEQEPPPSALLRIARHCKVDPAWLAWGTDYEKYVTPLAAAMLPALPGGKNKTLPLTGLAYCNTEGWYSAQSMAVKTTLAYEADGETVFAVLAVGKSMQPDGIREGYVAICDMAVKPEKGDAIYIRLKDGSASIKRFLKKDEEFYHIQGWLDPNKKGVQRSYVEQCLIDTVDMIACVVMVRRKA